MISRFNRIFAGLFGNSSRNSSSRMINFIVCGTQKGGTTALYEHLRMHPQVCMANKKEVHFFDNEKLFQTNSIDYTKYHSFFKPSKSHKVLGEATPIYMYWKNSPKRIFQYNPKMKLIILLRDPVERAFSHWSMEVRKQNETLSFMDAVKSENERCSSYPQGQHRRYSYVSRGLYLQQLKRIWKFFPREQVLVLKSSELREKTRATLDRITDFLDISRYESVANLNAHSQKYIASISDSEREHLNAIFKSEISQLEHELNWNCEEWLK